MYAIFETGGKQHKVVAGDVIRVEKLPEAEGKKIKFDKVLAINDGKETHIGTPYLDAATVDATVTAVGKAEKVIVFKFKAKKDYRRKQGHRQPFTEIEIESVSFGGKTVMKKEAPKKDEKPAPKKKDEEKPEEKAEDKSDADIKADDVSDADAPKADEEAPVTEDTKEEAQAEEPTAENDETTAEDDETPAESDETPVEDSETPAEDDETPTEIESDAKADEEKAEAPEAKDAAPADAPKLTKADIMAKLDELGAEYLKSAKKDELLAILAEAEK